MIAFSLTQTTQKTQKFSINANLDSNSQNLHDAAPVRHPAGDCPLRLGGRRRGMKASVATTEGLSSQRSLLRRGYVANSQRPRANS